MMLSHYVAACDVRRRWRFALRFRLPGAGRLRGDNLRSWLAACCRQTFHLRFDFFFVLGALSFDKRL